MPEGSNARRWSVVGLLFAAALINYLARATLSVALPLISIDFSLSPASKGLLLSAFFWSYTLMQIPMGWLADRWSPRWLYAGGFALWSMACGLTGTARSFLMLVELRMLLGIGEAIYGPVSVKIISESFSSRERGLPSGVFASGMRFGLVVGTALAAWLVTKSGWRHMFMLVGFPALLWIIPWLLVFPLVPVDCEGQPSQRATKPTPGRISFNRDLLGISLGYLCFGYYIYLLMTWLPDYLVQVRHFTVLRAGALASLPFLVWALAEPAGGWISDRLIKHGMDPTWVRKGVIAAGFLTGVLLIPAVRVANVRAAMALLCGASLVGFGASNILVVIQTCAPPQEVGRWFGVANLAANIGGVLAPLVMGLLISHTRSYFAGFALAPFLLLTGVLCFIFLVGKLGPPPALSSGSPSPTANEGALPEAESLPLA
ncbi:MAG: MFS transporter [Terriglobia bacterium]|jgi:MFS family permease